MQTNQSSLTALMSSFARAYHSKNDEPKIFNDYVAGCFMTDNEYAQIQNYLISGIDFFAPNKKEELKNSEEILRWIVQTQLAPTPLARARYAEDMLNNAIMLGAEQYVILGAGMDTFAYRNKQLLSKINVFEIDHPASQNFKLQTIKRSQLPELKNVHYVALDFVQDELYDVLLDAGFNKNKRTFFSLLGVSYYLTIKELCDLFFSVYRLSAKGSSIVFDYADENLFSSKIKRVQNMIAMAQASGEPMKTCFCYNKLEKFLEDLHFLIYEHLSAPEIDERFFSYRTDYLRAFENICYTLAVVNK